MSKLTIDSPGALQEYVGKEAGVSDWFTVTQDRIQQFADTTLDTQWIHVDQDRAKQESPFHATIAHGFLTLSLLPHLLSQILKVKSRMGVNYGLNRVRFISPVRSGTRIRARLNLQSLKEVTGAVEAVFLATVEGEDLAKPCCVAEWVVRYYL